MHIPDFQPRRHWILDSQAAVLTAKREEDDDVILPRRKLVLPTRLSSTITSCPPCEVSPLSRVKGLAA